MTKQKQATARLKRNLDHIPMPFLQFAEAYAGDIGSETFDTCIFIGACEGAVSTCMAGKSKDVALATYGFLNSLTSGFDFSYEEWALWLRTLEAAMEFAKQHMETLKS